MLVKVVEGMWLEVVWVVVEISYLYLDYIVVFIGFGDVSCMCCVFVCVFGMLL